MEENIRQKLHDTAFSTEVLYMTQKAQATTTKDKVDFKNIFKFCSSKDSIKGVKRQPTEWKKIFTNHVSGKRLKAKVYRELLKSSNKTKQANPNSKWGKNLNRSLFKENIQMANQQMKRSVSVIIK